MPKKDVLVETPATAWWFEGLRIGLGQKRPYGVEKTVEPEVFKKVKSGYSHTNKWRVYKSGLRLPRASLIQKAENILPGSAASFAHPIWKVGRFPADETISCVASEWLHQLNVAMLPWFFRVNPAGGAEVRRGVSPRTLCALTHRADLDAFTALSILLREAAENRRFKVAMAAGDALHQSLLHAAVNGSEQMQIVLPKIFAMLVARVFPFARDQRHYYCYDGLDLAEFCNLFRRAVHAGRKSIRLNSTQIDNVDDAIRGRYFKELGMLHFVMPKRPLITTGAFVEAEENFQAHMKMWQGAIGSFGN
jgi:hypothetical protein